MNNIQFPTSTTIEEMAAEIACLKATLSLVLKELGQANGGKIVIKMERLADHHENKKEAKIFKQVITQIRQGYKQ